MSVDFALDSQPQYSPLPLSDVDNVDAVNDDADDDDVLGMFSQQQPQYSPPPPDVALDDLIDQEAEHIATVR